MLLVNLDVRVAMHAPELQAQKPPSSISNTLLPKEILMPSAMMNITGSHAGKSNTTKRTSKARFQGGIGAKRGAAEETAGLSHPVMVVCWYDIAE
jgi:hypothetical protein